MKKTMTETKQFIKSWVIIQEPGFVEFVGVLTPSQIQDIEEQHVSAGRIVAHIPLAKTIIIGSPHWVTDLLVKVNADN